MKILHYRRNEKEYIVITEDDACNPMDWARPGFDLASEVTDVTGDGIYGLPLEMELEAK